MKKAVFLLIFLLPMLSFGQFKDQSKLPSISQAVRKPAGNLFLGFIDPSRLDIHHSFSMSYMALGNGGMMVNSYMGTIDYQLSNPLFLRLNVGLMNSPYNSFKNPALNNSQFFGGAELFYRPTENTMIKVGMEVAPGYYYPGRYNSMYGW
ncbi:MAG: hypothetical protein WAN36_02530 [Calditrichia bacterium]